MVGLILATHPLLEPVAFTTQFPRPLAELATGDEVRRLLVPGAQGALATDEAVRAAVRDLLRHSGYKPTGRGKPSSEYLARAVSEGALGSINVAVDAGNAVSLHSGLPVSVIDLDRAAPPFAIAVAVAGARYLFNAAGQEIDLAGLVCLFDAAGPCANAVKDAQRTKTGAGTIRTLSVVWGTRALPQRAARTADWYRGLLATVGATTEAVAVFSPP
jgi:DNA/RNA-binding domain of Phe-tRNA-synthetase-like protein